MSDTPAAWWQRVATVADVTAAGNRAIVRLASGRLVLVLLREGGSRAIAMDAACYHMGGPLADADDVEDLGGSSCISCPWHHYRLTLAAGEALYVALDPATRAQDVRSKGVKQRVHPACVAAHPPPSPGSMGGEGVAGEACVWVVDSASPPPSGIDPTDAAALVTALGEEGARVWTAMAVAAASAAGGVLPSDAYACKPSNALTRGVLGEPFDAASPAAPVSLMPSGHALMGGGRGLPAFPLHSHR